MDKQSQEQVKAFVQEKHPEYAVEYYSTIGTTNDRCFELLEQGHSTALVMADRQTAGQGRMGHSFFSPSSGIYVTLGFLIQDNLEKLNTVTAQTAVALLETVDQITGQKDAQIKWVNDIYRNQRKIAGILVKAEQSQNQPECWKVIIGSGINLAAPEEGFPEDIQDKAGAIFDGPVSDETKHEGIITLLQSLEQWLPLTPERKLEAHRIYRERQVLAGKTITYQYDHTDYSGSVIDIDDQFRLVVQSSSGELHTLDSGEVHIVNWK